ncbi:hypothetical protein MMC29_006600, partial [Sticta canariensis]|nr:hypothetical protein [Sticta canariensis]
LPLQTYSQNIHQNQLQCLWSPDPDPDPICMHHSTHPTAATAAYLGHLAQKNPLKFKRQ